MVAPITDIQIRSIKPPKPGSRTEINDGQVPGLYLRVTARGAKYFYVKYSFKGRGGLRLCLGEWQKDLTLAQARTKAALVKSLARQGADPRLHSAQDRPASLQASVPSSAVVVPAREIPSAPFTTAKTMSFGEAWGSYLTLRCQKENKRTTIRSNVNHIKRNCSDWDDRPLSSITKADIAAKIDACFERGAPATALKLSIALNTFFKWCVGRDYLADNPIATFPKPPAGKSREHVISEEDLKKICLAARRVRYPYGTFIELLLLTAQRRGEVAGMAWSELDFTTGLWTIPKERTKNGHPNYIPLTPRILAVLSDVPKRPGVDLLFSPDEKPEMPFSAFSKNKKAFDKECGVTGWCQHDLRRAATTYMAEKLDLRKEAQERLLNHISGVHADVSGIYDKAKYLRDINKGLRAWHAYLKVLVKRDIEKPAPYSPSARRFADRILT